MANTLSGVGVAFVATDGVDQIELTEPWNALRDASADVELLAPRPGEILGLHHIDHGDRFPVDRSLDAADPDRYGALVLPGGVVKR